MTADLDRFRADVRSWCEQHIPRDWRAAQTGVSDEEFARFQKAWFTELHSAGSRAALATRVGRWHAGRRADRALPELAAHDAPRLVLAFVGIHHAARRHCWSQAPRTSAPGICPQSSRVKSGSRVFRTGGGFRPREPADDGTGDADGYVVNGQKLWASGKPDWCLLLARTDPEAPKRKGISYFLLGHDYSGRRGAAHSQRDR